MNYRGYILLRIENILLKYMMLYIVKFDNMIIVLKNSKIAYKDKYRRISDGEKQKDFNTGK